MNLIEYIETHQVKAAGLAIGHFAAGLGISQLEGYHIPAIILETLQGTAYTISIAVGLITIGTWLIKRWKK